MNRVLLNNVDHHDLRVAPVHGADHGDGVNQMLIFPSEFEEAQRDFPIIFRRDQDGFRALALLGLDRDENLFLDGDRWTSRYVPAIARRGPFSIALHQAEAGSDAPADPRIHLDLDDLRVGVEDGLPLFLEHGGNAPYLDHVAAVLRVLFEGVETAPQVYAEYERAGLLQPVALEIRLDDERGYDLTDVYTIDQQALTDLSGEALDRLHRSGLLRAAIMAASSLGNVSHLIDRKNRIQARG
ncbi:SapC family protein [uncultured Sphingomonas sp.]|mgnify:CR=1 FL=1|uniref:SapC family protein n=1 Tax=uncultured Sphingomonas sp. TaxID=158754 RepID=UPI0025ED40E9|nr:SapC family protein [uncultured Sphingomonas sp.]